MRFTRYTVHGRGAKRGPVEHSISVWIHSRPVSNGDSFQSVFSRMPSLSHPKNHFWAPFSSWRHQRQFKTVRFLHPLPKVKVTGHFLQCFPKNDTFFRPKKGPRTGLSHSLTRLTAIQFSEHAKSKAQITERIFNEARSRCRSQKSIIFRSSRSRSRSRSRNAHQFFFTTGWIERFAQQMTSYWIWSPPQARKFSVWEPFPPWKSYY